ncbi:uncharacterized protein LOC143431856 [Xylocopa sonorina]|uniref:uncharacterized protein LOC143431856 n=1 Tax=Xylocopa sonorina TaxID=1818115 RepID=UPI00403AF5AF
MWNRKVFIRIIEVLICIACVVALRVTNDESRRVFHYLRSRSREWSLLNNITWGAIGAALATATCGGYVIITTGLLVAAATGELRGRKTEIFFLGLGVILFGIVGALSLASIENVPEDLVDNAAVFGSLCLLTALVFIADLLMSIPKIKDKQITTGRLPEKQAKQQTTSLTSEKEPKSAKKIDSKLPKKDDNGNINDAFEKVDEQQQKSSSEDPEKWNQDYQLKEKFRDQENRELKEYAQNFENRRALRDSELQRSANDESYRKELPSVTYKSQEIYQRPVDEVDTPRFPLETSTKDTTAFAKALHPGVKIMKVDRDAGSTSEDYRYSDTSQYDNVPVRMRGTSPKAQKKDRDVSFNIPPPPSKTRSEIEMLEDCFRSFRTVTTGTQTPNVRTPSSPNDPGFVRHTASNWPQESKAKTIGFGQNRTTS